MGGTYVVGDIHGCYDEWMELKNKIEAEDPEAQFILVGDIIDRGPKTMNMIRWAMENITADGKYQMVLGNHEYEKINWWRAYKAERESLIEERGSEECTIDYRDYNPDNYDFSSVMSRYGLEDAEVEVIIDFFKSLPLYKDLKIESEFQQRGKKHFVVVHAFFPADCRNKDESFRKRSLKLPKNATKKQLYEHSKSIKDIVWYRNYVGYRDLKNTVVVHGHTPTIMGELLDVQTWVKSGEIAVSVFDINVDCGCVYYECPARNLAAIRLEDLQSYYVYEKEILKESEDWE